MSDLGEFQLIERFFKRPARRQPLGVGDDCALLQPRPGHHLAISTDMLVEGRHFFADVAPRALGHKALAVNLSDLAACGARPVAFQLALSLPKAEEGWLSELSQGMLGLADAWACELLGGDTTAGPLNLCITVLGEVPQGQALLRSGARPGDQVWVSGVLGDARMGLDGLTGHLALDDAASHAGRQALEWPQPRIALGLALRGVATAAMDLSDGLAGDLPHLLRASCVGADIRADWLPRSAHLARLPEADQWRCQISGGDDYELLFTAPPHAAPAIQAAGRDSGTPVTCIGTIRQEPGLTWWRQQDERLPDLGLSGYDHFAR